MNEGLNVVIGADVSQGVAGINQFNKALANVKPGAAQATQAMNNLGRVVQDAPFGFIAISNNINPLLESFQRLKAETGTTGGAIKALLGSLIGGGGLGFAVSAVTSLLVVFGGGMSKAKKESEDAAKEIKSVSDVISEAGGSAFGSIAKVEALSKAVNDQTKTEKERLEALRELKQIDKEHFGDITLTTAALGALTKATQEYTAAVIQEAIIAELKSEIGKVGAEYNKQAKALDNATQAQKDYLAQFEATKQANAQKNVRTFILTDEATTLAKNVDKARKELEPTTKRMNDLTGAIQDAVNATLKFSKTGEHIKKIKEDIDNISHAHILNQKDLDLAQRISDTINGIKQPAKKSAVDLPFLDPSRQLETVNKALPKVLSTTEKMLDDFNSSLQGRLADMAGTLAGGLAEAIGQAIGGEGLKSALSGFLTLVGGALENIGKAAVELGVQILVLKRAMTFAFANPGLLIALGAAAIAAGAIIKSRIPKFAEGGIATKPTLGIFGEAGPEALIPLNKMNGMGGPILVQAEFRIRGKDLVAVANTGQRSLNRTT